MINIQEVTSDMANALSVSGPARVAKAENLYAPVARLCDAAVKEHPAKEKLCRPGMYALLGVTENGTMVAMGWNHGKWMPVRPPIPQGLLPQLKLSNLEKEAPKPVFVHVDPRNRHIMTKFENGKEQLLRLTPEAATKQKTQKPPKPTVSPEPSIPPEAKDFEGLS